MSEESEQCDDGNTFGGDGCAANCSFETEAAFVLDGAEVSPRSGATVQAATFRVALSFSGSQISRIGNPGADGIIPVTLRANETLFNPVPVLGFACICSRPVPYAAFGPGNAGVGQIGCGAAGLSGVDVDTEVDHEIGVVGTNGFTEADCLAAGGVVEDGSPRHPHTGRCNGPIQSTPSGAGPQGSAVVTVYTSFDLIFDDGSCRIETATKICEGGSNPGLSCTRDASVCIGGTCVPAKGANGVPCDDDDPAAVRSTPQLVVTTTGNARVAIRNANDVLNTSIADGETCGLQTCVASATGLLFDCGQIYSRQRWRHPRERVPEPRRVCSRRHCQYRRPRGRVGAHVHSNPHCHHHRHTNRDSDVYRDANRDSRPRRRRKPTRKRPPQPRPQP